MDRDCGPVAQEKCFVCLTLEPSLLLKIFYAAVARPCHIEAFCWWGGCHVLVARGAADGKCGGCCGSRWGRPRWKVAGAPKKNECCNRTHASSEWPGHALGACPALLCPLTASARRPRLPLGTALMAVVVTEAASVVALAATVEQWRPSRSRQERWRRQWWSQSRWPWQWQ